MYKIMNTFQWREDSSPGMHLWHESTSSTDECLMHSRKCKGSGSLKVCSLCRVICHDACINSLQNICRITFTEKREEIDKREIKNSGVTHHHWIYRSLKGNHCVKCKLLSAKISLSQRDKLYLQCSWCKVSYHNKKSCFPQTLLTSTCTFGELSEIIVPPTWITKISKSSNFNKSLSYPEFVTPESQVVDDKIVPQNNVNGKSLSCIADYYQDVSLKSSTECFVIEPIPQVNVTMRPLLVFINPKSGGTQGSKLLRDFQWLLNPCQVFYLSEEGPKLGLQLYKNLKNLRILVCGGDGTVGWVISTISSMNFSYEPSVAILPLGTGNDLARTLGWGAGYTGQGLIKILTAVQEGEIIPMDRWSITSTTLPLQANEVFELDTAQAVENLPLGVFNNYFSLGADAATALEFHRSREAHPDRFTSRFKNKMVYASLGGISMFKRSWKDLSEYLTIMCDGKDITNLLLNIRPHVIIFLNIPRYSAGTLPWGCSTGYNFTPQSINDGVLEVISLTTSTMAALQLGGVGERICQCRSVILRTKRAIPMQVDGEPCLLRPAQIEIQLATQSSMVHNLRKRSLLTADSFYAFKFNSNKKRAYQYSFNSD